VLYFGEPRAIIILTAPAFCAPSMQRRSIVASVRYIAIDIDQSVDFYQDRLGFAVAKHNPGKFAELTLDDLHLFLNAPGAGSAGKAGGVPQPGGWNRFMVVTDDLDGMIGRLREAGASFRGDIAEAGAGRQILLQDPSGNVVELFEYAKR
jgi:catechol 2,3-dioxygenase-like lactoylglutathione lyase family enzyme